MPVDTAATLGRIRALTQRADDRIFQCLATGGYASMSFDDIRYISKQLNEAANAGTELLAWQADNPRRSVRDADR